MSSYVAKVSYDLTTLFLFATDAHNRNQRSFIVAHMLYSSSETDQSIIDFSARPQICVDYNFFVRLSRLRINPNAYVPSHQGTRWTADEVEFGNACCAGW